MNRIAVAFRAFFAALFDAPTAERLKTALEGQTLPKIDHEANPLQPAPRAEIATPARSEALTLLAALQREARLVDLVKQPLANFTDEEIGAAARNVLGDCGTVLDRFFALQPTTSQEEGSPCDVPVGYDPGCYKLCGRVEGAGPFRGKLVHHGWKATVVKLPGWMGSKDAAHIVAPAEVEIL
jgi:Domain of unknown function (DUF2760)